MFPWSRQHRRSKSFPSFHQLDDILINIPSISHEQPPVEATLTAASLQDEINLKRLERELYVGALHDMWTIAQPIYDEFPDMLRVKLTASGDTALHVAVRAHSNTFVKELVNRMTQEDLQIPNTERNTAFCIAAIFGYVDYIQIMIGRNDKLPVIRGHGGMLPVHLAAISGHHNIVEELSSQILLENMAPKDIERLFFMTISSNMYDLATRLFDNNPANLAVARDDKEQLTALHMLARNPSHEFHIQEGSNEEASIGQDHQLKLLKKLWAHVRELEYKLNENLITIPSAVLFDAVESGNVEAVKWLLYMNPELLMIKDSRTEWSLLHFVAFYRQNSILDFILKLGTVNLIIRAVDKDRNNILHVAAHRPDVWPRLRSKIVIMQEELTWFKEVEKRVPAELRTMRNSKGKTPKEILYVNHEKLSDEVKNSAQRIAKSGMLVATLVATVVFAAALTVPGDDKNNAWFTVFILADAAALFTSSASLVSFLSIFSSPRFKESELISQHPSLTAGLSFVFIAITAMVIAFAAASVLIFDHKSKWIPILVASWGFLPISMYLLFHVRYFESLIDYFFRSRYRISKVK